MRIGARLAAVVLLCTGSSGAAPPDASAFATGRVAVLEFHTKLTGRDGEHVDPGYFTEKVRGAVLKVSPGLSVITRENVVKLLQAQGRDLAECESKSGCEVETGHLLGADLVITGELYRIGSSYKLTMKMHETAAGRLLSDGIATGKSPDDLDADTDRAVRELLAPLRPQDAQVSFGLSGALPAVPVAPSMAQVAPLLDASSADADVVVAHDTALAADDRGKEAPDAAARAWRAVAELKGKNPFRDEASAREKQWQDFADKKRAFEEQLTRDTDQLRKLLPLSARSVPDQSKVDLLVRHARLYGADAAGKLLELVPQPEAKRAASRALACEAREASACAELARLHEAAKDMARATVDWGRACDTGSAESCEHLGEIYMGGQGGLSDVTRGLAMLGKACDAGRPAACRQAGLAWDQGVGVKADTARSLPFFEKACSGGDGESCRRLALGYETGVGMPRDPARAETLLRQACKARDTPACARVEKIDAQLAAERRAREEREAGRRAEQDRLDAAAQTRHQAWADKADSAHASRRLGGVLIGAGAACALGAGVFAWLGSQQNSKVQAGGFGTAGDIQSALDKGKTYNTLTLGLGIGAAAVAGLGTALFIFNPPPAPELTLALTPSGIAVAGAFP